MITIEIFKMEIEFSSLFFPFLLGGLAGGALVSASRPRPVYVNPPQYAPYPPYNPYPPYRPYVGPGGYYNYQSGGYY